MLVRKRQFFCSQNDLEGAGDPDGGDIVWRGTMALKCVEGAIQETIAYERVEPADDDREPTSGSIQFSLDIRDHIASAPKVQHSAGDTRPLQDISPR
jgi:hypothetical protein